MGILSKRRVVEWNAEAPSAETISREELLSRLKKSEIEAPGQEREPETENISDNLIEDFFAPLSLFKKLSAKNSLIIEISTDRIEFLIAKKNKDALQIKGWGKKEFEGEDVDRYRAIEIALKYIKDQHYHQGMVVQVAFYSPDINVRQVVLPKLKASEIEKSLLYKNKTELPNFDEKAVWRYQVLETFTEKEVERVRTLVTVVPGEVIDVYMDLLKRAEINPDVLVPRPFALQAAYQKMVTDPQNDVLIDVGSDTTQVCFFMEKKLRFVRNFALGANNLQKAISGSNGNGNGNNGGYAAGRQTGASSTESSEDSSESMRERLLKKVQNLKSHHNPLLQVLLGEISRSLEFFRGPKDEHQIHKIFITGEGLKVDSVFPYLKNNLNYSVHYLAPHFSPSATAPAEHAAYTAALGLGIISDNKFNLVPPAFRTARVLKNLNILLIVLLVMFSGALGFWGWSLKKEVAAKRKTVTELQAAYLQLNPIEKTYNDYVQQIDNFIREKNKLVGPVQKVPQLTRVLKFFSNEVPSRIRLTSLTFKPFVANPKAAKKQDSRVTVQKKFKYTVNMKGRIEGDYLMGDVVLIDFINHLNELKYFKSIDIKNKQKNLEKRYLEFELVCNL